MSNPLNLIIADPEIRQQRIETDVLYPMNISDNAVGGQPYCRFTLKNRGFLSPDSRLILPASVTSTSYQYSPFGGVFSLIKRATLRVGAVVVQQVEDVNLLMSQMNLLRPLEHREQIDRPLHGVLSSFETCSGSTGQLGNAVVDAERLIGQHRSKGDLPSTAAQYREPGGNIYYMNANEHPAYRLTNNTTHSSNTNVMGTPEFSISLSQIFVGWMGNQLELPVSLINPDQKIEIELEFTQDGSWGANERVILEGSEEVAGALAENVAGAATTITAAGTNYTVGDILRVGTAGGRVGVIEIVAVGGGGAVTSYKVINAGSGYPVGVGMATLNLNVANAAAAGLTLDLSGAGLSAQWDLSLYDSVVAGQKCTIDTSNVRLLCDYIFYEDGKEEAVAQQMMSEAGLVMPYTQFRTIKTTINSAADSSASNGVGTSVSVASGSSATIEATRQIGLANEIVRQVTYQTYPVGTYPTEGKFSGMAATHPLLLNYCSMDSLVEDKGKTFQWTINSVPYNPSVIDHSQHAYQLHSECFGSPAYMPLAMWSGWCGAKQDDNQLNTANSSQPGFSTLASITTGTPRYELNKRKCGMANAKVRGHSCQMMNGFGSFRGQSFKLGLGNVSGNGIKVGAVPVVLDITHKSTNDPNEEPAFHSRNMELAVFAECERLFSLKNGYVSVSGASF